jgi:hypothetical protein
MRRAGTNARSHRRARQAELPEGLGPAANEWSFTMCIKAASKLE